MDLQTLMELPEIVEISSKMHEEEVEKLTKLLHGFLETKKEINKLYNMTDDDEQLKAFAINTAKALTCREE